MPVFTTACPCSCYSTCSMQVEVRDGRLLGVAAHPGGRATPGGVCLKGLSYLERVASPDRLLHPLRRDARSGGFFRIAWDDALDIIAEAIDRFRRDPGPQGIMLYAGSGTKGLLNRAAHEFFRLAGGYTTTFGDLCWPAGLEATRLTLGANEHSAPWDLANARAIVLWGKNPAETNIHQIPFIEQARRAGAVIVVVDPRRTETAERADLLVQPLPGTDGALALGLAHLLISREAIDRPFIERHVHGFPELAALAAGFPPDRAAALTGLTAAEIEALAGIIAAGSPLTINVGFGMQRYANSGQTVRAIIALAAITGNIGKPGAGFAFANLRSHIFDEQKDPLAFFPPAVSDGVVRKAVSTARLGADMLGLADPPLKMIWVERGNPLTQNPETAAVRTAFRALDFRVVVDQFLTDTAREADVVLPAKTMFEQTDVVDAYWHDYLQIKQKVIEPPGEVKPETEIFRLLAARLGLAAERVDAVLPGPTDADVERWLEERLRAAGGPTLAELRRGPVPAPGYEEVAFADLRFPTPSGKIELRSAEAHDRWGVDPLPSYSEPREASSSSPLRARYPLYLMTPNTKDGVHSQFLRLGMIRAVSDGPFAAMGPTDAAARGIEDGDRVRVFNDRGSIALPARLELGLRPGLVVVHNGWWEQDGGPVNLLSEGRETDMGHGAAFHECLVEIERA